MNLSFKIIAALPDLRNAQLTTQDRLKVASLRSLHRVAIELYNSIVVISSYPLVAASSVDFTLDKPKIESLGKYLQAPIRVSLDTEIKNAKELCDSLGRFLKEKLEFLETRVICLYQGQQISGEDVFFDAVSEHFPFTALSERLSQFMVTLHTFNPQVDQEVRDPIVFNYTELNHLLRGNLSFDTFYNGLSKIGEFEAKDFETLKVFSKAAVIEGRNLLPFLSGFLTQYFERFRHAIGLDESHLKLLLEILDRKFKGDVLSGDSNHFDELINMIPEGNNEFFVLKGVDLLLFHYHQALKMDVSELVDKPIIEDLRQFKNALEGIGKELDLFILQLRSYSAPFNVVTDIKSLLTKKDIKGIFQCLFNALAEVGKTKDEKEFYDQLSRWIRSKTPIFLLGCDTAQEAEHKVCERLRGVFTHLDEVLNSEEGLVFKDHSTVVQNVLRAKECFSEGNFFESLMILSALGSSRKEVVYDNFELSSFEMRLKTFVKPILEIYQWIKSLESMTKGETDTWGSGWSQLVRWAGFSAQRDYFETWDASIDIRQHHLTELRSELADIRESLGDEDYYKALKLSRQISQVKLVEFQLASKNPNTLSFEDLATLTHLVNTDDVLHAKRGLKVEDITKVDDVLELILYFKLVGPARVVEVLENEMTCRIQQVNRHRDTFLKDTEKQRSGTAFNRMAYRFAQVCRVGVRGNFGLAYASASGRIAGCLGSSNPQVRGNIDTVVSVMTSAGAIMVWPWMPIIAGMVSSNSDFVAESISDALRDRHFFRAAQAVDWCASPVVSMLSSGTMGFLEYGSWQMAANSATRVPAYLLMVRGLNDATSRSLGYVESDTARYLGALVGSFGVSYGVNTVVDYVPGMSLLQFETPEWVLKIAHQKQLFEDHHCAEFGFWHFKLSPLRQAFLRENNKLYRSLSLKFHPDQTKERSSSEFERLATCKVSFK